MTKLHLNDFVLVSIQFLTPKDLQIFSINMVFVVTSEKI